MTFEKSHRERYDVRGDVVRVVGLEPTSLAALEPKGDVTSVKNFFPLFLIFTFFHLLFKCLLQHLPAFLFG